MRKGFRFLAAYLVFSALASTVIAQTTTLTGSVKNSQNNEVVPAVSVTVKGGSAGTYTDDRGNFKLSVNQKFPLTLVFSSVGFETQEKVISSATESVVVSFVPASMLGVEVVEIGRAHV